ncbi:MAG: hypothetical protein EA417_15240 [Gammaproteobacteria bacterium]|nr:MAG: hypothetical protein EA417_15240 [Gammaproteobacteria bacterium]
MQLAPCLPEGAVCLSIAKGLDASARTPAQIFEHVLGANHHWGLVCGPMIARELAAGKAGFGVLAAPTATARAAVDLFAGTQLGLVADDDVHGSAWAVVLKNVYVPLVGAADALRLGDNMRGFLFTEAVAELEQIVTAMGGRPASARGLAGLGDLVTSATSESSHHRTIGGEIVSGRSDSVADSGDYIRSEGVHTARALREHALIHPGHYPLFDLACGFLEGALSLNDALGDYIRCRFSVGHA